MKVGGHEDLQIELQVAHDLGHRDHLGRVGDGRLAQVERLQLVNFLQRNFSLQSMSEALWNDYLGYYFSKKNCMLTTFHVYFSSKVSNKLKHKSTIVILPIFSLPYSRMLQESIGMSQWYQLHLFWEKISRHGAQSFGQILLKYVEPFFAVLAVEGGHQPRSLLTRNAENERKRVIDVSSSNHLEGSLRHKWTVRFAVWNIQGDQMLKLKVAQFSPKLAQKEATSNVGQKLPNIYAIF